MAGPQIQKRFALDSNILFDLAAGEDFAHTFREEFQRIKYALLVPPTVVQELMLKARSDDSAKGELALKALSCLREWNIQPFDLGSVGHGITEQFALTLIELGLLPEGELNDGLILAETSLGSIPILVTSDSHLLDMEAADLRTVFDRKDLFPVSVNHPKNLLRAIGIKFRMGR